MQNIDNNVLPPDFDGIFRFTNYTDTEFKAKWNNKEYVFPPMSTVPLIVLGESPEGTQYVRKKFAKELAEREYYNSEHHNRLDQMNTAGALNSFRTAVTYSSADLEPYIQKCLNPLPEARATVTEGTRVDEDKFLRKDNKGKRVTRVISEDESLIGEGTVIN